jgi:PiT family inorganic phosphate transporter
MGDGLWILAGVVFLALVFDYINGMHNTANAIATVVGTRVLTPGKAIIMAAGLNFLGAFLTTAVAKTIGKGIVDPNLITNGIVSGALLGAIAWNLITWWGGIPSSSSHALIGGLMGSVWAYHGLGALNWHGLGKIITALIVSPIIGLLGGYLLMVAILWIFHKAHAGKVGRAFKGMQIVSAASMALSHGSNDAQKAMGIITLALFGAGVIDAIVVPQWVIFACASAMAMGTAAGGWRIIKTLGTRVLKRSPAQGFAAESSASLVIMAASHMGVPVSTTHVISSTIMGVGTAKRLTAVRWEVAGKMLVAWVLTIPASAFVAYACAFILKHLG